MGITKSKQGFSSDDLNFLTSHTGHEKKVIKKWSNRFKKACPDGHITPAGLVSLCDMFFPYLNSTTFCDFVFETFDTDQKGHITLKEFMQIIGNATSDDRITGMTSEDKLKWAIILHDMWLIMARLNKLLQR